MDEKRRRRFSFSLRTLFAAVTLAALCVFAMRLLERREMPDLEAVEAGMTQAEVYEIIGQPERSDSGFYRSTHVYHWLHYGTVEVKYIGDRVESVKVVAIE